MHYLNVEFEFVYESVDRHSRQPRIDHSRPLPASRARPGNQKLLLGRPER